jgi:hypothetical protein
LWWEPSALGSFVGFKSNVSLWVRVTLFSYCQLFGPPPLPFAYHLATCLNSLATPFRYVGVLIFAAAAAVSARLHKLVVVLPLGFYQLAGLSLYLPSVFFKPCVRGPVSSCWWALLCVPGAGLFLTRVLVSCVVLWGTVYFCRLVVHSPLRGPTGVGSFPCGVSGAGNWFQVDFCWVAHRFWFSGLVSFAPASFGVRLLI